MTKLARASSAGASDGDGSRLLWAGTGAAGALLVAGIALVVASKLNRRSKRMQPA
ncbi:MAG TPA: hypothetical protein VK975_07425 [Acidimicrobiales bacterium]|nr:hypothetical protein [Acidimicrobiales bacterium]